MVAAGRQRILLAWSSGKDSAWALRELRAAGEYELAGLLTSYSEASRRVPQHEVRLKVVELQAIAARLPLAALPLPFPCPNTEYERRMRSVLDAARARNISAIAYGDLHLSDIREYRERLHHGTGVAALFPLWGRDTAGLALDMVSSGLRAIVTCADTRRLPAWLAGTAYDAAFLQELPSGVDLCGENGEFHTCVVAGEMFSEPLRVVAAAVEQRDGFAYCDVLPVEPNGHHAPLLELFDGSSG